ncbi:MAG: hypothetical protein EA382_07100, partial [Spirochaetaceae bacterium]
MRLIRYAMINLFLAATLSTAFAGGQQQGGASAAPDVQSAQTVSDAWRGLDLGFYDLAEFQRSTGIQVSEFHESPLLASRVAAGSLPPVAERLPDNPAVQIPWENIGEYGGTMRYSVTGGDLYQRYLNTAYLLRIPPQEVFHRTSGPRIGRRDGDVLEAWEMNRDGTVHTMTIRRGLRWSDGAPVTTEDIRFYVEDHLLNTEVTPAAPEWLRWGEPRSEVTTRLEIVDRYTVNIVFSEPNPGFNF